MTTRRPPAASKHSARARARQLPRRQSWGGHEPRSDRPRPLQPETKGGPGPAPRHNGDGHPLPGPCPVDGSGPMCMRNTSINANVPTAAQVARALRRHVTDYQPPCAGRHPPPHQPLLPASRRGSRRRASTARRASRGTRSRRHRRRPAVGGRLRGSNGPRHTRQALGAWPWTHGGGTNGCTPQRLLRARLRGSPHHRQAPMRMVRRSQTVPTAAAGRHSCG